MRIAREVKHRCKASDFEHDKKRFPLSNKKIKGLLQMTLEELNKKLDEVNRKIWWYEMADRITDYIGYHAAINERIRLIFEREKLQA